jgi:hypothetical protein
MNCTGEKRAGILPNRNAGSKRKLYEPFTQISQIIHSFSTGDFLVDSRKNLKAPFFTAVGSQKLVNAARSNQSSVCLGRQNAYTPVCDNKNSLGLDQNRVGLDPHAVRSGGAVRHVESTVFIEVRQQISGRHPHIL